MTINIKKTFFTKMNEFVNEKLLNGCVLLLAKFIVIRTAHTLTVTASLLCGYHSFFLEHIYRTIIKPQRDVKL